MFAWFGNEATQPIIPKQEKFWGSRRAGSWKKAIYLKKSFFHKVGDVGNVWPWRGPCWNLGPWVFHCIDVYFCFPFNLAINKKSFQILKEDTTIKLIFLNYFMFKNESSNFGPQICDSCARKHNRNNNYCGNNYCQSNRHFRKHKYGVDNYRQ